MSATVPQMPPEAGPVTLSEPQRIINVFVAPSKTFEDIRSNASWWVPWILLSLCSLIFGLARFQKLDTTHLAEQRIEQSRMAQQRMEQLSPAQREEAIRGQARFIRLMFFAGPIGWLLGAFILAAVFLVVFNFGFGAEISFQRYLSIAFYALLPAMMSTLLTAISVWLNSDPGSYNEFNPLASNPAYFMERGEHKFLYGIAAGLDIFSIWVLILLGLGIAKNSAKTKIGSGAAIATVFVCYVLLVLGGATIGAAF